MSYVTRLALVNQASLKSVSSIVLGLYSCVEPPWVVPSNIENLCQFAGGALPEPEILLSKHTVYPVVAPFLPPQLRSQLARQITMTRLPGRSTQIRTSTWEGNAPARMAWCIDCVQEDCAQYGFGYWHREHQLIFCTRCPMHRRPLMMGCGLCTFPRSQRATPALPAAQCQCGRTLRSLVDGTYDRESDSLLSRSRELIRSFFDSPLPLDKEDHVTATLQERAIDLGLMKNGTIQHAAVRKLIQATDGGALMQARWPDSAGAEQYLTRPLALGKQSANLAINIILIGLLFSTNSDFRVALERNRQAGNAGRDYSSRPRVNRRLGGPNHTQRYLRQREEKDRRVSDAIRERHAAVLASDAQPVRFSKAFFLGDIEGGRSIVRKLELYPLCSATIEELSETFDQYLRRRAKWLMRQGGEGLSTEQLLKSVRNSTFHPPKELQEIYNEFLSETEASTGQGRTAI